MLFRADLQYILSSAMAGDVYDWNPTGKHAKTVVASEGIMGEVHYHNHCTALHDDILGSERNPAVACLVHADHILQAGPSLRPQP